MALVEKSDTNIKWFLQIAQNPNGNYYANLVLGGKYVEGLEECFDCYESLFGMIQDRTSIEIDAENIAWVEEDNKKYGYAEGVYIKEV